MFGRLLCAVGLHSWERRTNPRVGGSGSVYHACRRCGVDRLDIGPSHDASATRRFTRQ